MYEDMSNVQLAILMTFLFAFYHSEGMIEKFVIGFIATILAWATMA